MTILVCAPQVLNHLRLGFMYYLVNIQKLTLKNLQDDILNTVQHEKRKRREMENRIGKY